MARRIKTGQGGDRDWGRSGGAGEGSATRHVRGANMKVDPVDRERARTATRSRESQNGPAPAGAGNLRSVLSCVLRAVLFGSLGSVLTSIVMAQEPAGQAAEPQQPTASAPADLSPAPAQVSVHPVAHDEQIRAPAPAGLTCHRLIQGPASPGRRWRGLSPREGGVR